MNRDEIIRMAREAGCVEDKHYKGEVIFISNDALERFFHMAQAAEREKFQPILDAAQGVIDWTESKFREPVRDELEFGRMVYIRLHALADLYDAIRARGQA